MNRRTFLGIAGIGTFMLWRTIRQQPIGLLLNEGGKEIQSFFRFSQRLLTPWLDDVTVRVVPNLEKVLYLRKETGELLDVDFHTNGHLSYDKQRAHAEEVAKKNNLSSEQVVTEVPFYDGVYRHNNKCIMLRRGALSLEAAGHEFWHASANSNYSNSGEKKYSLRRLEEAFAIALGEIVLVDTYRGVESPQVSEMKARKELVKRANVMPAMRKKYGFSDREIEIVLRVTDTLATVRERFEIAKNLLS